MTEVTDTGLKLLWGTAIHTRRGAGGLNQALDIAVLLALFWRMDLCQNHFLHPHAQGQHNLAGQGEDDGHQLPSVLPSGSPCAAPLLCCRCAAGDAGHRAPPQQQSCFVGQRRDRAGQPWDKKFLYIVWVERGAAPGVSPRGERRSVSQHGQGSHPRGCVCICPWGGDSSWAAGWAPSQLLGCVRWSCGAGRLQRFLLTLSTAESSHSLTIKV